jgi:O-antigen/teichoic acid export membrane protein
MSTPYAVHVARGSSYFILQNIATTVMQVAAFAVLTRLVSPDDIGVLAVLLLVSGVCTTVATLSLDYAMVKFMADFWARGEKESAASVFYKILRITFTLSIPLAAGIYLGAPLLSTTLLHQSSYSIYFRYLSIDIVLNSGLLQMLSTAFFGIQKFRQRAIILTLNVLMRQILIITLIILLHDFLGLVIAWVIADSIIVLVCLSYLVSVLGWPRFNFSTRELLSFSWPLFLKDSVGFVSTWFDRTLLLIFVPLATLGIYNATLTAYSVLTGVGGAALSTLLPAFSSMQSPERRKDLDSAFRMSTRYASLVLVPLAFGLFATSKPALTLFVGGAYVEGTIPLMILTSTWAFMAFAAAASSMLIAIGETKLFSLSTIITVVVELALGWILTQIFGMLGAATARGIGTILGDILVVLFLWSKMKLRFDNDGIKKSLVAAVVMAAVVLGFEMVLYSKYLLPAYTIVGCVVYLVMLRMLKAVKQADIQLMRDYLGPKFAFVTNLLRILLLAS